MLDDDADPLLANRRVIPSLKAGSYTAAMDPLPVGYVLTQITCTSFPNGGSGVENNVRNLAARTVTIRQEALERTVCTFVVSRVAPLTVTINRGLSGG